MDLTYGEIENILDMKNITTIGYTLPRGIYEFSDIKLGLKSLLPDEVKVISTIDDIRLKTNSTISKTIRFTIKSFFNAVLGFTQSH